MESGSVVIRSYGLLTESVRWQKLTFFTGFEFGVGVAVAAVGAVVEPEVGVVGVAVVVEPEESVVVEPAVEVVVWPGAEAIPTRPRTKRISPTTTMATPSRFIGYRQCKL
jgi:hypothetical protein